MSRFAKGGECLTCIRLDHDCWDCRVEAAQRELANAIASKQARGRGKRLAAARRALDGLLVHPY